jgi:septal ring factor EnvC (AmiA/AmiB activator)
MRSRRLTDDFATELASIDQELQHAEAELSAVTAELADTQMAIALKQVQLDSMLDLLNEHRAASDERAPLADKNFAR